MRALSVDVMVVGGKRMEVTRSRLSGGGMGRQFSIQQAGRWREGGREMSWRHGMVGFSTLSHIKEIGVQIRINTPYTCSELHCDTM